MTLAESGESRIIDFSTTWTSTTVGRLATMPLATSCSYWPQSIECEHDVHFIPHPSTYQFLGDSSDQCPLHSRILKLAPPRERPSAPFGLDKAASGPTPFIFLTTRSLLQGRWIHPQLTVLNLRSSSVTRTPPYPMTPPSRTRVRIEECSGVYHYRDVCSWWQA